MKLKTHIPLMAVYVLFTATITSCKKLVDVPEPINTITTAETFSTDGTATSAVVAIYNDLITGYKSNDDYDYGNGLTTFDAGLSADEFNYFNGASNPETYQFQHNALLSSSGTLETYFWNAPYFNIYLANAGIEGLQASTTLTPATKTQLLGEAEFLRAYDYFYMVNFYGTCPLVTTTAFVTNAKISNATPVQIYQQIINDLQSAQSLLPGDYSVSGGQRIRANKWAATALLARVYLYYANITGDASNYSKAAAQATSLINNTSLYQLTTLDSVFLANSQEAILQLQPNSQSQYATWEGFEEIPNRSYSGSNYPTYYLTTELLSAFEPNDNRKAFWVDTNTYNGITYYFPYKYKVKTASSSTSTEYYMMLRLGEQYLIRAESEANGAPGGTTAAIADLNVIRNRAGLAPLPSSLDQEQVIAAVAQERRIELFAEWGHRWFDLKRTKMATTILSKEKGFNVSNNDLVYPIPLGELQDDPFLKQNPGY